MAKEACADGACARASVDGGVHSERWVERSWPVGLMQMETFAVCFEAAFGVDW